MELILGLRPLTQFDAAANSMLASFSDAVDRTPYSVRTPAQALGEMNAASAPVSRESSKMDLSREDRAPRRALNEAIWKSVKGAASPMPAPVDGLGLKGTQIAEEDGH